MFNELKEVPAKLLKIIEMNKKNISDRLKMREKLQEVIEQEPAENNQLGVVYVHWDDQLKSNETNNHRATDAIDRL